MRLKNQHYKKIELIPGWLDFPNAELMYELTYNREILGTGNILEVGTFFGKSATALAFAEELIENIEKYLIGFTSFKNSETDIFQPKLELILRYKEPKKYNRVVRRILTAILSRI